MWRISNSTLMEAYKEAKELNLDPHFIKLLEQEMKKRSMDFRLIKQK